MEINMNKKDCPPLEEATGISIPEQEPDPKPKDGSSDIVDAMILQDNK